MKNSVTYRTPASKIITIILLTLSVFSVGLLSCKKETKTAPEKSWYPDPNLNGDIVSGVFENMVPCTMCDRIKVELVIYKNPKSGLPTTYLLARTYIGRSNTRIISSGNITITRGTQADPTATVYQLDPNAPEEFRLFWKVDDNRLLMLDADRKPQLSNVGLGYVLNRT